MDSYIKTSVWQQFGAAIDYLEDSIEACPENKWADSLWLPADSPVERPQFWYVAYHTLFWLDLYLTGTEDGFLPPAPFSLIEQDENGPIPERVYTKAELLDYLKGCRQRCHATIEALTDEAAQKRCWFSWGECSFLELLIYNLRHVHGHASQLNMLLGQTLGPQPDFVTQAR
jgi:hypothetical protein